MFDRYTRKRDNRGAKEELSRLLLRGNLSMQGDIKRQKTFRVLNLAQAVKPTMLHRLTPNSCGPPPPVCWVC